MDETSFKKLLLQFEKRVYKNQEMRIKFPDLPEKLEHFIFYLFIYTYRLCSLWSLQQLD